MKNLSLIVGIAAIVPVASSRADDLLRFDNGDQLHGTYQGINDDSRIIWQREDIGEPVQFAFNQLRHIVLRNGQPQKAPESLSLVELVTGDRIPGTITSLDASFVRMNTAHSGPLEIPRNMVTMMAPQPFGGRIHYYGPFSDEGWEECPSIPPQKGGTPPQEETNSWQQIGAAWYSSGQNRAALIRKSCLPTSCVLRFDLAWKQPLQMSICLNASFAEAKPAEEKEKPDAQPGRTKNIRKELLPFGNSQVVQVQANYLTIYQTRLNEEGEIDLMRSRISNSRLELEESRAHFEFRIDRQSGHTMMFVNDAFIAEWDAYEQVDAHTLGAGLGFLPMNTKGAVRISNILISEWNRLPDSARSLQADDQDVLLLTNGLDRASGRATTITGDGQLLFQSKYGNASVPLSEIAELHFARDQHAPAPPLTGDGALALHFGPMGVLHGEARPSSPDALNLLHPVIGNMAVSIDSAIMLEFDPNHPCLSEWDANF